MRVSCPARVDIGNRLDYPSFFLSLPAGVAKTANIAVELRTTLTYLPGKPGCISFVTHHTTEEHAGYPDPSRSSFPVLCAVLHHFGITSGVFRIESQVPPGSGLGGSGMLTVAAIGLVKTLFQALPKDQDRPTIALLAHFVENWLGFSSTGLQDQLAAVYGGANLWSLGREFRGRGSALRAYRHYAAGRLQRTQQTFAVVLYRPISRSEPSGRAVQGAPEKRTAPMGEGCSFDGGVQHLVEGCRLGGGGPLSKCGMRTSRRDRPSVSFIASATTRRRGTAVWRRVPVCGTWSRWMHLGRGRYECNPRNQSHLAPPGQKVEGWMGHSSASRRGWVGVADRA